jgi:PTS system cellobiose-specific IIA component
MEELIFGIISHGGNARGMAYEAFNAVVEKDYEEADKLIKEAEEEVREAHKLQTSALQREAGGEKIDIGVIFVHAQDHLMTAMAEISLLKNMIAMQKRIHALEERI